MRQARRLNSGVGSGRSCCAASSPRLRAATCRPFPYAWPKGKRPARRPGYGVHSRAVDRPAVLVVDDEPSIRLLCRINLELEGFDVLEAGTLAEARAARRRAS